jgi:hypothetical protein
MRRRKRLEHGLEAGPMPDGKRKRRHSVNQARRRWYAQHRSRRFSRRFGWGETNSAAGTKTLAC